MDQTDVIFRNSFACESYKQLQKPKKFKIGEESSFHFGEIGVILKQIFLFRRISVTMRNTFQLLNM